MPTELFHKIADEIVTIPQITAINLMGLNEPLLDSRIEEFTRYLVDLRPKLRVGIYTNGLLLTPLRHDSLVSAGLHSIIVSLNAVRPEQHEQIMRMKGKFDTICANIDYARNGQCRAPHFEVHAVYTSDTFTQYDVALFYERWGSKPDGAGIGLVCTAGNFGGMLEVSPSATGIRLGNTWCFRATNTIYITCDGLVTTCCMDPFGRQVFGDLKTQTIRESYNSEPYVKFREAHVNDRADEFEICANCTRI
jgi:hypothetical protein